MDWSTLCNHAASFRLTAEQLEPLRGFFEGIDPAFFLEASASVAGDFPAAAVRSRFPVEEDQCRFLLLCAVVNDRELERLYHERAYPAPMYDDISGDLAVWVRTLIPDFGFPALTWRIFSWFQACLLGGIKQFGRLQCEIDHLFSPKLSLYRKADGTLEVLPWNAPSNPEAPALSFRDKTINLHIPALGALQRSDCVASIRRMVDFSHRFQPDFDFRAVVCYSWILDAKFREILKPDSNILEFQKLGHNYLLPGVDETREVIWRLWGAEGVRKGVENVEHKTSMQRRVAEYLQGGGTFGEGGLVIFRDELPELFKER